MIAPLPTEHGNQLFVIGEAFEHVVGSIQRIVWQSIFAGHAHDFGQGARHGLDLTDTTHIFGGFNH